VECICAESSRTPSSVATTFIVHYQEWKKPTNTAKVASLLLGGNSQVLLRGAPNIELSRQAEEQIEALDQTSGLVLYPSDDAISLRELVERDGPEKWRGATLIVPDGTWSQSRRVVRRQVSLQRLPHVKLGEHQSTYQLRRHCEPGLLCTLEAVGFALAELDPSFDLTTYLGVFERWQHSAIMRRWGKIPDWEQILNV
jgi:DTW domain-containing protein YfiP